MSYQTIKNKFKRIINQNLQTTGFLKESDLTPYRTMLKKELSTLKFYKYLSFNNGLQTLQNLKEDNLIFSLPSTFNDAFEATVKSADAVFYGDKLSTIKDSVAISCFSEKNDNFLMFAHYANSFNGICIEYDFSLYNNPNFAPYDFFYPVIYSSRPPTLVLIDKLYDQLQNQNYTNSADLISYFTHKASCWKYEREWRFIIPLDKTKSNMCKPIGQSHYKISGFDCISKVYIGCKVDDFTIDLLKSIIIQKNSTRKGALPPIKLYKTERKINAYKLTFNKIL